MVNSHEADVVVVGAGIGGSVLALALARRNWSVLIVERERTPRSFPRAEILWPVTARLLDDLGVGRAVRQQASVPLTGTQLRWYRQVIGALDGQALKAVDGLPLSTEPGRTREIVLGAALHAGNVQILRGVDVRGLLSRQGRICGVRGVRGNRRCTARGRLIVGDDGSRSNIRDALGIRVSCQRYPLGFITAVVRRPRSLPARQVVTWIDPTARFGELPLAEMYPWPGGRAVLLITAPREVCERYYHAEASTFWHDFARLAPVARRLSSTLAFPADFHLAQTAFGHAGTYVADGAALIGDAAHPMSPAGAQGANAAIWDGLALAEVSNRALTASDVSRRRLREYERIRRPANDKSLSFSVDAARSLICGRASHRLMPTAALMNRLATAFMTVQ